MKANDRRLIDAVARGDLESVRDALSQGASPNASENGGYSVLMAAVVECNDLRIAETILKVQALTDSVNRQGSTALHLAAMGNRLQAVSLLLKYGADRFIKDRQGATPFTVAVNNAASAEVLELLMAVEKNTEDYTKELTAILIKASIEGKVNTVEYMLEKGADIDGTGVRGFASIHWAAEFGHNDVLEFLLSKGADSLLELPGGGTALHRAALCSQLECVKTLIRHGTELNKRDSLGDTPLHLAISGRSLKREVREAVANALLHAGAHAAELNNGGYTPRLSARAYGLDTIVSSLLPSEDEPPIDESARGIKAVEIAYGNAIQILFHPNDCINPLTIESGHGREGGGMNCDAGTFLDRFGGDLKKANGMWFLPYIERLKRKEVLSISELREVYQNQFGQLPKVEGFD